MTGLANVKKGDKIVLVGFTGIRLSTMEVTNATKTELQVTKQDGTVLRFDRKSGKQVGMAEGKEKYANTVFHPDDAPENKKKKPAAKKPAPAPAKATKTSKKPAPKKVEVEEDEDLEDDDDEFEEV